MICSHQAWPPKNAEKNKNASGFQSVCHVGVWGTALWMVAMAGVRFPVDGRLVASWASWPQAGRPRVLLRASAGGHAPNFPGWWQRAVPGGHSSCPNASSSVSPGCHMVIHGRCGLRCLVIRGPEHHSRHQWIIPSSFSLLGLLSCFAEFSVRLFIVFSVICAHCMFSLLHLSLPLHSLHDEKSLM